MLIAYSVKGATYTYIDIPECARISEKVLAYKEDVLLNFVSPAHMEPYGGPWGLFKRFYVLVYNVFHPGLKLPCLQTDWQPISTCLPDSLPCKAKMLLHCSKLVCACSTPSMM